MTVLRRIRRGGRAHEKAPAGPGREGGEIINSILVSVVVSCIASYMVSRFTIKRCFDAIDNYVKETTDELHDALGKLIELRQQSK